MQPVVNNDESSQEQTMLNEVNIDFRIPGLPLRNFPIEMLFNKIYDKTKCTNPFSPESKQMIQDVRNLDLFELFETDPETQCKAC